VNSNIYPWQVKQWQNLADARSKDRIPHALLLTGRPGLGIDHFAACFAAHLLCTDPASTIACGQCKSCILFKAGNHPDMLRIGLEEDAKQIKVDQIRDLIQFMQLSSQYGRHKIAVIHPAEAMNRSAANSLLKTLEEPPAGVIFMLISYQPANLAVTVRSRCQRIDFSANYHDTTLNWICEQSGCDQVEAADLLSLSEGQPVYALELRDSDILKYRQQVLLDLQRLQQQPCDVVSLAKKWQDYGAVAVLQWLMSFLNTMTRLRSSSSEQQQFEKSTLKQDLQQLANRLDLHQLVSSYDLVFRNYQLATGPYNLNQAGLLEEFIVYWQSLNSGNRRN